MKSVVTNLNVIGIPFFREAPHSNDPLINFNIIWNVSPGKRMILSLHLFQCKAGSFDLQIGINGEEIESSNVMCTSVFHLRNPR